MILKLPEHRAYSRSREIWISKRLVMVVSTAILTACGGDSAAPSAPQTASCTQESFAAVLAQEPNTTVKQVKAFSVGEALIMSGQATANTPKATQPLCVVDLLVGPGNPGLADAPATSTGIGIEVVLPSAANWNRRIHVLGNGGWLGSLQGSDSGVHPMQNTYDVAQREGAVSAATDGGNQAAMFGGSFLMNPDGSINTTGWKNLVEEGIHQTAVKAKILAQAYYGTPAKYSYYEGGSTGGRLGVRSAQAYPADFNGILANYPSINWTRLLTAGMYPQIVYQRDLGGVGLSFAQADLVSNAAIAACDFVGGQHLGFILDPSQCRYDPTKDLNVLCASDGGTNTTNACVTRVQAQAANKIWYGMTSDGSVPDPAVDIGWSAQPSGAQRWYGLSRGTSFYGEWYLTNFGLPVSIPVGYASNQGVFSPPVHQLALELLDPKVGDSSFVNARGNGQNTWKAWSYSDLNRAFDLGVALQPQFSYVNSDDPNLSAFKAAGRKMISVHGLNDEVVPPPGSINYYNRVAEAIGGFPAVQSFYKLYLVAGMGHASPQGTSNPNANPPIPTNLQPYQLLTDWVEKGLEPGRVDLNSPAGGPASSLPMCPYPQKPIYKSGNPLVAASYVCG